MKQILDHTKLTQYEYLEPCRFSVVFEARRHDGLTHWHGVESIGQSGPGALANAFRLFYLHNTNSKIVNVERIEFLSTVQEFTNELNKFRMD
jgi:hypothetical protein